MSDLLLKSLDVSNFRSIRGQVYVPLDANVVLVHGENGAGKTSLLSAIELALTGRVQSLERADQGYEKQLLHRSANEGRVTVETALGPTKTGCEVVLLPGGVQPIATLDKTQATFFRERAFLPQSLLGQLLQIYQDAGSDASSPLAQFVGRLLGLDQLDALEAGLKPLADIRNVRKNVDGWLAVENENSRLTRLLSDQRKVRDEIQGQLETSLHELTEICANLGLAVFVDEETLGGVATALADETDTQAFAQLADQRRALGSLKREIDAAQSASTTGSRMLSSGSASARDAYANWQREYGPRIDAFRARAQNLFPEISLESAPDLAVESALRRLRAEKGVLTGQVTQARGDIARHTIAIDEREVAIRQRETIDEEVERLPSSAGSLASALAELTSFISGETCPVCDRNFGEVSKISLGEHVHDKVRTLSASAERLLVLGRTRAEIQVAVERLDREITTIGARRLDEQALANLDRRLADVQALIAELEALAGPVQDGSRLLTADIATRRAVSEAQSRHVALAAARETLSDFAISVEADPIAEGETFDAGMARLDTLLADKASQLDTRLSLRRKGADLLVTLQSVLGRRQDIDSHLTVDLTSWQRSEGALRRAQTLRDQGNSIRTAVDTVRSAIIRREFNKRLNRVWRDLFVRLAPVEPFVPAFRIPEDSTQKLQPKLITEHRDGGDAGGTPGAMLSAGNLNTAALTLFIALHLSVPRELPWLILDDPVQSMDDVHIAHFAALLRTLSKEHGRQVIIAVHDRQLFEYLKLELSPAFAEDSLLTLELSRGPRRDTLCVSRRYSFKEETALLAAA